LAAKCNLSKGPVTVLFPAGGISVISSPGQTFYSQAADEALFAAWKENLRTDIPTVDYPGNINDPAFAELCVRELLKNIDKASHSKL
jgi:uncharacterized protein (UPF0261 family)